MRARSEPPSSSSAKRTSASDARWRSLPRRTGWAARRSSRTAFRRSSLARRSSSSARISRFNALRLLKSCLSFFAFRFASSAAKTSARRFILFLFVLLNLFAFTAAFTLSLPSPSSSSSSVSSSPKPLSKYNSFTKFASATLFDTGTSTGSKYFACFALYSFANCTATTSSRASSGGLNEHPGCSGGAALAAVVGAVNFFANLFTPLALGAFTDHTSNGARFTPFSPPPVSTSLVARFATARSPLVVGVGVVPLPRTASRARLGGGLNIFPARRGVGVGYVFDGAIFSHAASTRSALARARSRLVRPPSTVPAAAAPDAVST